MPNRRLPPFALCLLLCAQSFAADKPADQEAALAPIAGGETFYQDKERGWFWYEDPEPEPEKIPEPPKPVVTAPKPEKENPPKTQQEGGPMPGSVAWIKANLPKLREIAIDNPSDENIQAYYYAQRLMMDKSEHFSRRSQEVIRNDPLLDEDLRYPVTNAASDAIASAAGKQKEALMKMIAGNAGLIFFFRGEDCALCEQTVSAVTGMQHKYGFTVIPISLDGKGLPSGAFPQFKHDNGLADHLGVITAPALALAVPPSSSEIISYSAISMETAVSRILFAGKKAGLITEQEYNATSRLSTIGLIDGRALEDAPADITDNTAEFVTRMRDAARRAYQNENGGNQ